MEIAATLVKKLRDMTDAGMMECKKALVEVGGDIEKAVEYLRQKGLTQAAKKADRIAAEGAINLQISSDFTKATMLEINSETDFVAKNDSFKALGDKTLNLISSANLRTIEELNSSTIEGNSFEEYLKIQISKIGENIVIRRFVSIGAEDSLVNGYLHSNGRVGCIIALNFQKQDSKPKLIDFAKNLCMHIAAMKPSVIGFEEFSDEFVKAEKAALVAEIQKDNEESKRLGKPLKNVPEFISRKEITDEVLRAQEEKYRAQLKAQNKPEAIWDKIIPGQMERFIADNTLLDQRLTLLGQFFVMDDKKTIARILEEKSKELGDNVAVARFVRFELGEGIEKKEEDFAKEVANQMK